MFALGLSMPDEARPTGQRNWDYGLRVDKCEEDAGITLALVGPRERRRPRTWPLTAAAITSALLWVGPTLAAAPSTGAAVTECDRLAASPEDPEREAPGVPIDKIEAAQAIERCTEALVSNGQSAEAVRLYNLAADQGYAPAQFNLADDYDQGIGGLVRDE
jgi:hypothetical protein